MTDVKPGQIVWEDPPTPGGNSKWQWVADELRANPGRWARFPGGGYPVARGVWAGFDIAKRRGVVYLRWPSEPAAVGKPVLVSSPKPAPSMLRRNPTVHPLPSLVEEMDRARVGGVGRP